MHGVRKQFRRVLMLVLYRKEAKVSSETVGWENPSRLLEQIRSGDCRYFLPEQADKQTNE